MKKQYFTKWAFRIFDEVEKEQEQENIQEQETGTETPQKVLTQEDVNKAVASALKRERAKSEKRAKEAEEAVRLQSMTEAERTQERMKQLEAQILELTNERAKNAMASTVRGMLSKAGVSGYNDDIVNVLVVADDADATKSRVDAFVKSYQDAVNAGIRKSVAGRVPKSTGAKPTMTKEEILKIQDPLERQRAIKQNISLFKK